MYFPTDVIYLYDPQADTITPEGGTTMDFKTFMKGIKSGASYKIRYKETSDDKDMSDMREGV